MCKAAVSIIVGWRVSPAVHHQFVSHSVPLSPPFPFSLSLLVPFFQSHTTPPHPTPEQTRIRRHTRNHTPLWASWIFHAAGCVNPWGVLFQTRTHPLSSPCTGSERTGDGREERQERWGDRTNVDRQQTGTDKRGCETNERERKGGMHRCNPLFLWPLTEANRDSNADVCCLPSSITVTQNDTAHSPHRDEEEVLKHSLYHWTFHQCLILTWATNYTLRGFHECKWSATMTSSYVSWVSKVTQSNRI